MRTHTITLLIAVLFLLGFVGCDNDDCVYDPPPAAPQGVCSITGDNAVYIYWNGPYERDIAGYIIWRSLEPFDNYREIGRVDAVSNPNLDLLIYEYIDETPVNGVTYYYAVSAYDIAGHVSDLSAEEVFDTPRPDGQIVIFDTLSEASLSGYSLAAQTRVHYSSAAADVFVDRVGDVFYLNAADTLTDLQDMGHTASFDDISYAPQDGWSENGWAELILHHTYVIWTRDLHFAKIRVLSINSNSVTFQWAYQTDQDNPELAPPVGGRQKPAHGPGYLVKNIETSNAK